MTQIRTNIIQLNLKFMSVQSMKFYFYYVSGHFRTLRVMFECIYMCCLSALMWACLHYASFLLIFENQHAYNIIIPIEKEELCFNFSFSPSASLFDGCHFSVHFSPRRTMLAGQYVYTM